MELLTSEHIIKAMSIAVNAHDGQKYGDQPYIVHPVGVAQLVADAGYTGLYGNKYIITALLHDVVEDSSYNILDIEYHFGHDVGSGVDAVTKRQGESYDDYLERVAENHIGLVVKFYDVYYNHKIGGRDTAKYRKAYEFLKQRLFL